MRLFKKLFKPESPAEKAALARLDEVTREVAAEEGNKEWGRERATLEVGPALASPSGPHGVPFHDVPGDPVPEPVDDPDPADSRSMREVMHETEPEH